MKANERFLAMSLCVLVLSLLFVFSEKIRAAEASDTKTTTFHEESVFVAEHGASVVWADEGEEEYKESPNEEQYREEPEEEGSEYETAPSDPEHQNPSDLEQSAPQWPSDEESQPSTPNNDDDEE
jgi:hypothetical protein